MIDQSPDLLYTRNIYGALGGPTRLPPFSEENRSNRLWLCAWSIEYSTQDMCDYINSVLKPMAVSEMR